jgi:hypothetical protein
MMTFASQKIWRPRLWFELPCVPPVSSQLLLRPLRRSSWTVICSARTVRSLVRMTAWYRPATREIVW